MFSRQTLSSSDREFLAMIKSKVLRKPIHIAKQQNSGTTFMRDFKMPKFCSTTLLASQTLQITNSTQVTLMSLATTLTKQTRTL